MLLSRFACQLDNITRMILILTPPIRMPHLLRRLGADVGNLTGGG